MWNLENIIQIISIFVFFSGGFTFFFKTGGYKSNLDTKLLELQNDIEENKQAIKELKQDVESMKSENAKVINTLNSTLSEIKAKIELLVQYSGIFNGNNGNKK